MGMAIVCMGVNKRLMNVRVAVVMIGCRVMMMVVVSMIVVMIVGMWVHVVVSMIVRVVQVMSAGTLNSGRAPQRIRSLIEQPASDANNGKSGYGS